MKKVMFLVIVVLLLVAFGVSAFMVGSYLLNGKEQADRNEELAQMVEDARNNTTVPVETTVGETQPGEIVQETVTREWYHSDWIEEKIHQEFPEAEVAHLPEFPSAKQNEMALLAASRHKEVVFVTYCNARPYQGTDCLTRRVENLIDCVNMSNKLGGVVHFGNPYALQPLQHVKRKIFGYTMPATQPYCIDVLKGTIPAKGTLPFNIEFQ